MNQNITEAIGHLEAYRDATPESQLPKDRLDWIVHQRHLLHAVQELILTELEDAWYTEQVERGHMYGS